MGCGCNKTKAATNFAFTHPKTKAVTVYRTEVEARAAQIRNGGGTYSPVPAR